MTEYHKFYVFNIHVFRIVTKTLFLGLNLCLHIILDSLSCSFKSISFLTNGFDDITNVRNQTNISPYPSYNIITKLYPIFQNLNCNICDLSTCSKCFSVLCKIRSGEYTLLKLDFKSLCIFKDIGVFYWYFVHLF